MGKAVLVEPVSCLAPKFGNRSYGTMRATMGRMAFFIQLIVIVIVLGLLYWLVLQLPIPEPFRTIIKVIVILGVIVWLLNIAGLWPGARGLRISALPDQPAIACAS